jgi:hypothetical protein
VPGRPRRPGRRPPARRAAGSRRALEQQPSKPPDRSALVALRFLGEQQQTDHQGILERRRCRQAPDGVQTGLTAAGASFGGTVAGTAFGGTGSAHATSRYSLKQAAPARFAPRMSIVAHPVQFNRAYRAIGTESPEPPVLPLRDGALLGVPKYEWSSMPSGTAVGDKVAVAGDFYTGYRLVERIGITVEVVPHTFGANGRPIGARGMYAYGRNGGSVVAPQALRYLALSYGQGRESRAPGGWTPKLIASGPGEFSCGSEARPMRGGLAQMSRPHLRQRAWRSASSSRTGSPPHGHSHLTGYSGRSGGSLSILSLRRSGRNRTLACRPVVLTGAPAFVRWWPKRRMSTLMLLQPILQPDGG